jgi:omega-6 fatty acid desaturase (delta-12 desaturase)
LLTSARREERLEPMSVPVALSARSGKALHDATRPFAEEFPARSWWYVLSTLVLVGTSLAIAGRAPWLPVRLAASILGAMLMVRAFILYHDYMHGALLRGSRLAKALFYTYGVLSLTPPHSWRSSHNYHHANVGTIIGSHIGSFPILTTDMWRKASRWERLEYRVSRSPVTLLSSYVTIFAANICLLPFLKNPRAHWDSVVSLLVHGGLAAVLWVFAGFQVAFLAFLLPSALATAFGGFVFYAQHNFKGMHVLAPAEWTYYEAALRSSSYLELGPAMDWLTGNIGYHHVHHLNPLIPFYRLPEAMDAIPELQTPVVVKLRPRDVLDCFRLALWDPERERMVSFREARAAGPA